MPLSADHRQDLERILNDLRTSRIPIDMPRIKRALIAILAALLQDGQSA